MRRKAAGPLAPWRWHRATVRVLLRSDMEGKMVMRKFPGIVHGCFGIYRQGTIRPFNLVHPPTGCTLASLPKQRQCRALAVELAALAMNWEESDPEKVGGADAGRVFGILMKAERTALPGPQYR